ncbi:MAG: helix-turn-helix domain-containing protein [Clostridiaceae bacterium]|nr:helix-turn-helix domain-containing protein [Clostridiaceae bacterium]
MRIRTIRETAKILKEMDPETRITENTLRKLITEGNLPHRTVGKTYLLDVDTIIDFFKCREVQA